jgi:hypothetical protein
MQKDTLSHAPDPEVVSTTIQTALSHGSRTEIGKFLGFTRQYFTEHWLAEGGVFFEALRGLFGVAVKDPTAFIAIVAYFNSLFAGWSEQAESREPVDELIGSALHYVSELLMLRSRPGTKHGQIVAASRLQATATRLTAKLDGGAQRSNVRDFGLGG